MPLNVRIFGYRGMVQAQVIDTRFHTADTVFFLEEPYLWSQKLTLPDDGTPVSSAMVSDLNTAIVKIEVDDGRQAFIEIRPLSGTNSLGDRSPLVSGENIYEWGPGYTIACATPQPIQHSFLLLADGTSFLLQSDGTSRVILPGGGVVPPPSTPSDPIPVVI